MSGLTEVQQRCLSFIRVHRYRTGSSPSYREIAAGIGLKSRGRICQIIENLEARGVLRRIKGRYRSIELIEPGSAQSVLLNDEIHRLLGAYATEHSIALDTAANELLRQTLGAS